jgi:hypothetical protein
MSFEPPEGILDIGNATLRVGKLEVAETSGLNQGLQNIIKNDLLITENTEYAVNHKWGLKLPTAWVAEFEVKGHSGKYIDFNFYNENSASNAQGYNLTFMDTSLTLKYDGGSALGGVATIPTIVGAYRKVNIFFERGVISVSIDGTRYLYFKESDGYNQNLGVASRVVSATGGAFVNVFIEENADNSAFKNLRIVNGRFISDQTSNIAFIGGNLGVGVHSPKESLDIRGNMHLTRVSNVSQIKVDSNVVTEYTGPHDRPLRKYPEVAMTSATTGGYTVTHSGTPYPGGYEGWRAFDEVSTTEWISDQTAKYSTSTSFDANSPSTDGLSGISGVSGTRAGSWVKLELPKKIRLQKTEIFRRDVSDQRFDQAYVYGSNDDTNWYQLSSITNPTYGQPASASGDMGPSIISHSTDSTTFYKYFVIQITSLVDNVGTANIGQAYFYGHEEGSGSLDTTLKTVYNVPATTGTQLEVYYDAKDLTTMPSTVTDLSPNTNTGAVSGHSPTLDSTDGIDSFKFNGSSQYVTGAHGLTTGSDPVHTISLWLNAVELTDLDYVVQLGQGGTSHQQSAIIFKDNKIGHAHWGSGVLSEVTIANNVWYHVVAVFTGGNGSDLSKHKIFINGEDGGVGAFPGSTDGPVVLTGTQLTLGRNNNQGGTPGNYLKGSIANFRLYSKALNAGQVQELYDYQKDYFLGSKSQVTLYKGHLGVGVTEPSGQLELAGDERIQEYPPRGMTANETLVEGHGVFCAYASSLRNGYSAWWALDKTTTVKWASDIGGGDTFGGGSGAYNGTNRLSSSTALGAWLKLKCPYKIKLHSFNIAGSPTAETPEDFIIYGSNDENTWDQLFQKTGHPANTDVKQYTVNSISYYKYFAVVITKVQSSTTIAAITEWRLFGTPGPTTLDKGSLTLGRSLDVPRVSRYDVDTETPRPEKLVLDFDTTVNSSPTDISGKGNHGTLVGATYSPADKAFNFSGNQYIEGTSGLSGDPNFTVSWWMKLTSRTGTRVQVYIGGNPGTPRTGFGLFTTVASGSTALNGTIYFESNDFQMGGVLELNQWNHITFTHVPGTLSNTTVKVYLNGVQLVVTHANTNPGSISLADSNLRIGGGNVDGDYVADSSQISNFKLYEVALEPSEVKKLYNLGRTGRSMVISDTAVGIGKVPEAQLDVRGIARMENLIYGSISHRLIDEAELYYDPTRAECQDGALFATGANGTINDIKGNHPGTLSSMTRYNYFWSAQGSGSWVQTTGNIDLRRDWTIMTWFGPSTTDNIAPWNIIGHGQTNSNDGLHVSGSDSTRLRYGFHSNDIDASTATGMTRKREWFCITVSYYHNGGVAGGVDRKMYQNERLICHQQARFGDGSGFNPVNTGGSAQANGDQPYQADPTPLRFGASYGSGNYGQIYQQIGPCLMIPRFLGDGEVRSLYRHFAGAFPAQINVG